MNQVLLKIKQKNNIRFLKGYFPSKASFDWRVRDLKNEINNYNMLKNKYGYIINDMDWNKKPIKTEKIVWTCWFQGEAQAPDIVKLCLNSIKKNLFEYKIIILDNSNITKYVSLPDYIWKKYKKKQISVAHFSDLVRLNLLNQYGGFWIDATVLCTSDRLINRIQNSDLDMFCYKDIFSIDSYYSGISNWFMYSKKSNTYLETLEQMLLHYWKKENNVCDYFIFHIFFMIIKEEKNEYWENIPTYCNSVPHLMQNELFALESEERMKEIMSMSDMHKLSYKFLESDFKKKNTMYYKLKEMYL